VLLSLEVLIEGDLVARIRMNKATRLSLDYEPSWRDSPNGYSLSVSMPLAEITYSHKAVWPYLWNLLPENPTILVTLDLGPCESHTTQKRPGFLSLKCYLDPLWPA
jgi:HipA-like protein